MKKYGFVYIWFDCKHKRYYIGMHWGTEDDGYVCSSTWMMQAYKRRSQDFKRRILEKVYTNRKDLYEAEIKWLSLIDDSELKIKYYNLSKNVSDSWLNEENVKTRLEKISVNTKEAMQRPEVREKYLDGLKTRDTKSSSLETRAKRSISMKGKNAGKATVKYKDGGKAFHVTKDDPRLLTGELVYASKGVKRKHHTEERVESLRKTSHFHVINSIKEKCIHCDFMGNAASLGRYHNDRCKKKNALLCT